MNQKTLWTIVGIVLITAGCNLGPRATGEAGTEFIYMVPGDRIRIDKGEEGYVNASGYLVGIANAQIQAAGRLTRDVAKELTRHVYFDRYDVMHSGKREIEVRGAVKNTGKFPYPLGEDWHMMNLLMKIEGFTHSNKSKEFLLVRKSWTFAESFVFIRGEAAPSMTGIGGDILSVLPGDLVIFPGQEPLIYVFGAIEDQAECFSYDEKSPPTLKVALEQSGGFLEKADRRNIYIYRVLRSQKQSIFTLDWKMRQDFALEPWDIVYVPPKIPRALIENNQ